MKFKIILLFTFITLIHIQGQPNDEWLHFDYGNSPLPSDGVYCIAIDSLNNKWFGTNRGLTKFDGINWKIFTKNNGLIYNRITAIAIDKDNNIWVFDSLLSKYNGYEWKHFHPSEYPNAPKGSRVLAIDDNNIKWMSNEPFLGDQSSLISFNDTSFHVFSRSTREELSIVNTLVISENVKWIGTYGGLLMYDDNRWVNCGYDTSSHSYRYSFQVEAMDIDINKTIWIFGYVDQGPPELPTYYRYTLEGTNDWKPIPFEFPYGETQVITTDKFGNKWIGIDFYDLYKLNNDSVTQLTNHSYTTFSAIVIDKDNNKWIGHWADGISIYREGGVILTSLNDRENNFQNMKFKLEQNYPNPFNPSTKIKYSIPSVASGFSPSVTLKVYDVLGNEITTLVSEEKPAGEYDVEFDAASLPSGVYFYQLNAGEFIQTMKMILLK